MSGESGTGSSPSKAPDATTRKADSADAVTTRLPEDSPSTVSGRSPALSSSEDGTVTGSPSYMIWVPPMTSATCRPSYSESTDTVTVSTATLLWTMTGPTTEILLLRTITW